MRWSSAAGALAACLLPGCLPSLGPFVLEAARGRVVDQDTGEPIRGAEVVQWYRGAGTPGDEQPRYYARWTQSDPEGRFAFERAFAPSLRMWLLKTYGPSYSFYHPNYGLERGARTEAHSGGDELVMRGSLRRSAQALAEVAVLCRRPGADRGARHLAEVACPLEHHTTYPDGQPRAVGPRDSQGRRTGIWSFYYEDGSLAARGEYEAGAAVGRWEFRDRRGQIVGNR